MGILVSIKQCKSSLTKGYAPNRVHLDWTYRGHSFSSSFSRFESVMSVKMLNQDGIQVEEVDLPFNKNAQLNKLARDLKLKLVSEYLMSVAINYASAEKTTAVS